jgi:hypothetical protein
MNPVLRFALIKLSIRNHGLLQYRNSALIAIGSIGLFKMNIQQFFELK